MGKLLRAAAQRAKSVFVFGGAVKTPRQKQIHSLRSAEGAEESAKFAHHVNQKI
jgi:hypothetical protein